MINNVTFCGGKDHMTRKAIQPLTEEIVGLYHDASTPIEKGMVKSAKELAKKANSDIVDRFADYNVMEREAAVAKLKELEQKASAEAALRAYPPVPFN